MRQLLSPCAAHPPLSLKRSFVAALCALAACLGLLNATDSEAASLVISGGQLVGATGVNVGDNLYSVSFVEGTCIDLFTGCDEVSDFDFSDAADAIAASQALLDQVFLGIYDSNPQLTFGCENYELCQAATAYGIDPVSDNIASAKMAVNDPVHGSYIGNVGVFNATDTSDLDCFVLADWTLVPEPTTALLLAAGLAGLAAAGRRRSRR